MVPNTFFFTVSKLSPSNNEIACRGGGGEPLFDRSVGMRRGFAPTPTPHPHPHPTHTPPHPHQSMIFSN